MLLTQRLFKNKVRGAAIVTALFWYGGSWEAPGNRQEDVSNAVYRNDSDRALANEAYRIRYEADGSR